MKGVTVKVTPFARWDSRFSGARDTGQYAEHSGVNRSGHLQAPEDSSLESAHTGDPYGSAPPYLFDKPGFFTDYFLFTGIQISQ